MDPVSMAAVRLGIAAAKSACKLWCGDNVIAADVADSVADLLQDQLISALDQRAIARSFDVFADKIAQKVLGLGSQHFGGLPPNEREAAIKAVAETFAAAPLTEPVLYRLDMDALSLERHLKIHSAGGARRWALSEEGTAFYELLLRESCAYVLEVSTTLPRFVPGVLTELLRRLTVVEEAVTRVLERIPGREAMGGDEGFAADYRRQVVKQLDRMELFGATVSDANRGYPLSVAYISLNVSIYRDTAGRETAWQMLPLKVSGSRFGVEDPSARMRAGFASRTEGVPVPVMLARGKRLFVRGEAGCGKTTLLQWIAVTAAHQAFPSELADWNRAIPFFIPLRRFAQSASFPQPEHFLDAVGSMIGAEMPTHWVHRLLRSGQALLLIDGVDELPASRRADAAKWLRDLVTTFPDARYVVTSRPAAVPTTWLAHEAFATCVVQPMAPSDIRQFIAHWHDAMRSVTSEKARLDELGGFEEELQQIVAMRRELRQLATNPLLCALLCALNRDRRTLLPHGRIELYRVALEMFLQRRDSERQVAADTVPLTFDDKFELLQDIAYWLMRNGLSDAPREQIEKRLGERLRTRRLITASSPDVLTTLLERSGLLREPETDRIDFIHRTFQEYLAAQAALAHDDVGLLIDHATDDQWHQTIVLAVGLSTPKQRNSLLSSLLDPPRKLRMYQSILDIVALASMETAGDLTDEHAREITKRAKHLLPPSFPEHVTQLAAAGDLGLELIDVAGIATETHAKNTARLAALVGSATGMSIVERLAHRATLLSVGDLVELWEYFDPDEYARRVLSGRAVRTLELASSTMTQALDVLSDLLELDCRFNEPWDDYSFLERLPELRTVRIGVPFGTARLALAAPPKLETIIIAAQSGAAKTGHTHLASGDGNRPAPGSEAGLRLEILGLDSARVLDQLTVTRPVHRIVIADDPRLENLRELTLPPTLEELTLARCPTVKSLSGLENMHLPALRSITLVLSGNAHLDVSGLLTRHESDHPPVIDQIKRMSVSYGDIGDLIYQMANSGLLLDATGNSATWTRREPPPEK